MKKLVLSAFLCLSSTLVAQEGISYEIEPVIGYNNFDGNSKMENDFTYGIRASAYMNEFYGYRFGYERADNVKFDVPPTTPDSEKRTNLQRVSASLLINGEEEYSVIPYLFGGLGYEILSNETASDVSQGYVDGGIGFKYIFLDYLNMNIEAKVLKKFDTSDLDYGFNFGFGYIIGGSLVSDDNYLSKRYEDKLDSKISDKSKLNDIEKKASIESNIESKNIIEPIVEKRDIIEPIVEKESEIIATVVEDKTSVPKVSKVKRTEDEPFVFKDSSDKQYYVQMAAWFKGVYKKLPAALEKKGYEFTIKDTVRKNQDAKIVIVSPYENYSSASTARVNLLRIKKDAFITKI